MKGDHGRVDEKTGAKPPEGPHACAACGNPSMLFTPNARRDPFAHPRRYEPAWQCARCGHLEFIAH